MMNKILSHQKYINQYSTYVIIEDLQRKNAILTQNCINIALVLWSEWRDLNSRPLDPQSSALPTAPHPDILFLGYGFVTQRMLLYHRNRKCQDLFLILFKYFLSSFSSCFKTLPAVLFERRASDFILLCSTSRLLWA